jgi:PhnB protein
MPARFALRKKNRAQPAVFSRAAWGTGVEWRFTWFDHKETVMTTVNAIPQDMHTVTPYLVCEGAAAAMAFYTQAFDAVETARLTDPNGKIMHASMRIGDSTIMLVDDYPDYGSVGPKALKGSPVTLHLYVDDVDQAYDQAVAAGGTGKTAPADMFWGDRYALLVDPFGHNWSIATHIRDMTPDEIKDAMAKLPNMPQCTE